LIWKDLSLIAFARRPWLEVTGWYIKLM